MVFKCGKLRKTDVEYHGVHAKLLMKQFGERDYVKMIYVVSFNASVC